MRALRSYRMRSVLIRLCRRLIALAFAFLVATGLGVFALRWLNPAATPFMRIIAAGERHGGGRRQPIEFRWTGMDRISPAIQLAVVAAEDQNFPYHHGFDWTAIDKALVHNRRSGRLHGASTISQQVAKNLFLWPDRTWFRKGLEAYFTVLMEAEWPKWRILEMYLNVAQFDNRLFGVGAAARHLFHTTPDRLTRMQAALLAAALPAPDRFDPASPSGYLLSRSDWILQQMDDLGSGYLAGIKRGRKHR